MTSPREKGDSFHIVIEPPADNFPTAPYISDPVRTDTLFEEYIRMVNKHGPESTVVLHFLKENSTNQDLLRLVEVTRQNLNRLLR